MHITEVLINSDCGVCVCVCVGGGGGGGGEAESEYFRCESE